MSNPSHPEWREENALTAPSDRNPDKSYLRKLKQGTPALSNEQTAAAMADLSVTSYIEKFPAVERLYADRPIHGQQIGLVSFVPAKGAAPNEQGIYGFMKLRGNFATEVEANERAEFIVRNEDSYHKIFHAYVGRPFPLTLLSSFSAETSEIDIRKAMTEAVSSDIRQKKVDEQNTIKEIHERQAALIADTTERKEADPYETYITDQVKLANLKWHYSELRKKMEETKESIIKTRLHVAEADAENPEFKAHYFERYMEARRQAGLKNEEQNADNFIKYMVQDIDLGF